MKSYQLKFEDGSVGYCEGQDAFDARRIAEHFTGKEVAGPKYGENENIKPLPYPCRGMIWQFEHPVVGKTPSFCTTPSKCAGRGSCPHSYSCTE